MSGKEVKKGVHKGGDVIRLEPSDMSLLKSNPGYEDVFRRARCLNFFQKMDGHHIDVSYKFALNYDGKTSRVGDIIIPAIKINISLAT